MPDSDYLNDLDKIHSMDALLLTGMAMLLLKDNSASPVAKRMLAMADEIAEELQAKIAHRKASSTFPGKGK